MSQPPTKLYRGRVVDDPRRQILKARSSPSTSGTTVVVDGALTASILL